MRHGTYSIVALDPATGELGAAVQSHWFSVGSLCTWARPGVGAVATQSVVEPAHGPAALDRLAAGEGAREALDALLAERKPALVGEEGWRAIDAAELERGRAAERPRVKLASRDELLAAAR